MTTSPRAYVLNDGRDCPCCESCAVRKGRPDEAGSTIYRECWCDTCGASWTEEFYLSDYSDLEEGNDGSV